MSNRIVYAVLIAERKEVELPCVAFATAELARSAAEAREEVLARLRGAPIQWQEQAWQRDGRYPEFYADVSADLFIRVYPIEIVEDDATPTVTEGSDR